MAYALSNDIIEVSRGESWRGESWRATNEHYYYLSLGGWVVVFPALWGLKLESCENLYYSN
jgi:hypothetical protein